MRVLIVEDDAALSRLLKRGLTEAGFSVDAASDGESGLHFATTEACDAVVLDLMVPRLPGLEVLRALRARGRNVPVLILTARDAVGDRVAGLDCGADDYVVKPFVLAELVARLRALIRRDHRVASASVRVADLEVDLAARRVVRAGRTIELPAKQFALLELLALHQGRIVTRTQIHEKIWDGDNDTLSNVVDVHVCRLRELVDRAFGQRLIHTVRGQGYLLAEKGGVPCRCDGD